MLKILSFPIALLYSFFAKIRNWLYDYHILKSFRFPKCTIISIGNITVGGTGKTPLTEFLISELSNNYKIAILSRGYKRKTKGFKYVETSDSAKDTGDEPLQIKQKFPQITVAVCKKRYIGIKKIYSDHKPDVVILDDAFQHRKISPDLAILLTDYNRPFYNDFFLPAGRLRDNKSEVHRADIVIVTKTPQKIRPIEKSIWRDNLHIKPYQNLFFSSIKYESCINLKDKKHIINIEDLKNHKIFIISAIANSKHLVNFLKEKTTKPITHFKYHDHKFYTQTDIDNIATSFNSDKNEKKIIITTEKDAVKFQSLNIEKIQTHLFFIRIKPEFLFDTKEDFLKLIKQKIYKN